MTIREIETWTRGERVMFAPVGVEHGEEIFSAPAATTEEEIEAAWAAYEAGQVPWMALASGAYWE
jgi:hypothetical protein